MNDKQACFMVATVYQGYSAISLAKATLQQKYSKIYFLDCTKEGVFSQKQDGWMAGLEVLNLGDFYKKGFYARCILTIFFYRRLQEMAIDDLYIYNDRDPLSLYFSKKVKQSGGHVTLVEEGLSMYREPPPFLSVQTIKDLIKAFVFLVSSNTLLNFRFGFSRNVNEVMLSEPEEFKRKFPNNTKKLTYYKVDFGDEKLNKIFVDEYIEADFDKKGACSLVNVFLYLGQPLSELKILKRIDEIGLIVAVKEVAESKGYSFVLKPHPSDSQEKYDGLNVNLFKSKIPVEAAINIFNITAIGSFSSSALYNVAGNRGVKVFMLSKILNMDYEFPKNERVVEVESLGRLDREL